jgi:hypothetical protein
MHEVLGNTCLILVRKVQGKRSFERIILDGRTVLKCIFEK